MQNKKEAVAALLLYGAQRDVIDSKHLDEMMQVAWFREANCRFNERAMEGLALLSDRLDTFGMSMRLLEQSASASIPFVCCSSPFSIIFLAN